MNALRGTFRREWARLARSFTRARERVHRWLVPPYRTVVVDEILPKHLKRRTLYVVQEDGFEEQAAMICPCGCGRILHMNLLPDERPCWRLTRHPDGSATFTPRSGEKRIAVRISGSGKVA